MRQFKNCLLLMTIMGATFATSAATTEIAPAFSTEGAVSATPESGFRKEPLPAVFSTEGETAAAPVVAVASDAVPPAVATAAPVAQDTPVAVPLPAQQIWVVTAGSELRQVLDTWVGLAGWQPIFWPQNMPPYTLHAEAFFSGSFETAIQGLFDALPPDVKLTPHLHPSNRVVAVELHR